MADITDGTEVTSDEVFKALCAHNITHELASWLTDMHFNMHELSKRVSALEGTANKEEPK